MGNSFVNLKRTSASLLGLLPNKLRIIRHTAQSASVKRNLVDSYSGNLQQPHVEATITSKVPQAILNHRIASFKTCRPTNKGGVPQRQHDLYCPFLPISNVRLVAPFLGFHGRGVIKMKKDRGSSLNKRNARLSTLGFCSQALGIPPICHNSLLKGLEVWNINVEKSNRDMENRQKWKIMFSK